MPYLDPLQTCLVTLSVPVLPSVVNLVSYCYRKACQLRNSLKKFFNILSSISILTAFIVVIITIAQSDNVKITKRQLENGELLAWVILSVVLMSARWIETYSFLCRRFIEDSKDKRVIDKGYVTTHMCSSFLRIILLIALFPTLYCPDIRGINETYDAFMNLTNTTGSLPLNCIEINITNKNINTTVFCLEEGLSYWLVIGPFLAHTIAAFLTTHFGVLACRLRMQRIGFALPLTIATPLYVLLVVVFNETGVTFANGLLQLKSEDKWLLFAFFIIGWAGQFWICRHAWFKSRQDRLSYANK